MENLNCDPNFVNQFDTNLVNCYMPTVVAIVTAHLQGHVQCTLYAI